MCKYKEPSMHKFDKFETNANKNLTYLYPITNTQF